MINLPQPRRRSQPSRPGLSRPATESLPLEAHAVQIGWSPADELAALEAVWESLCQDAETPAALLQLPTISSTPQSRGSAQRPLRQRHRLADAPGRLAS